MRGLPVMDVGMGWRTKSGVLTKTDHRTGPNQIVEAKMGNSHKDIRKNQKAARAELGDNYRVDHFTTDDIGKAYGGALALLFPAALAEDRRRPEY